MFTVSGVLWYDELQRRRALTWNDGAIGGDARAIDCVMTAAERLDGEVVGPIGGPVTRTQHLAAPCSAAILMARVFLPETVQLSGDVPPQPPTPADLMR